MRLGIISRRPPDGVTSRGRSGVIAREERVDDENDPWPLDQPFRGPNSDRLIGIRIPPRHLRLFRRRQLRKRWYYVSFWSPELLLCAARVEVGPLAQRYWAVWDRQERQLTKQTRYLRRPVKFHDDPKLMRIDDRGVHAEVTLDPSDEFVVYRPEGRAYIWSRKALCVGAQATVTMGGVTRNVEGVAFVDDNAGYHFRHTQWRWSAGAGLDAQGRTVAWNAIVGLFDTKKNSERTLWIDGVPTELDEVQFSDDLKVVTFTEGGSVRFEQEADLLKRVGLFVIRSKYDHAFGSYSGTLPGDIELREAFGVRERQDALW